MGFFGIINPLNEFKHFLKGEQTMTNENVEASTEEDVIKVIEETIKKE